MITIEINRIIAIGTDPTLSNKYGNDKVKTPPPTTGEVSGALSAKILIALDFKSGSIIFRSISPIAVVPFNIPKFNILNSSEISSDKSFFLSKK